VDDYPGRWSLEHRNTLTRRLCDWVQGRSNWGNPHYGTAPCRLEILDGDPAAVPVLLSLLRDEDFRVRRVAAASLGRVGPPAREAVPALLEAADRDDDAFLRGIARLAALAIDKEAAERAGVSEHFIFCSPQPRLWAATADDFFLDSPASVLADGKILAWDDTGGAVRVYGGAAGSELACFRAPAGTGWPTAFSPDARTAASASKDKNSVKVWDLATGKELAILPGCAGGPDGLAFSPDGKTLALEGDGHSVLLWDLATGEERACLRGHTDAPRCLRFSPDGKTLASAGMDRTVRLWEVTAGKCWAVLRHGDSWGGVTCLAFSPDGKTLASGNHDYTVKLWDVATGTERATLEGYDDDAWVDSVSFSPDGRTLASVSRDTIFLWDVATGRNTAKILAEFGDVAAAAFTPDGKLLALSNGDDHRQRLWEFAEIPAGTK
jgi:WD40 repeat protein